MNNTLPTVVFLLNISLFFSVQGIGEVNAATGILNPESFRAYIDEFNSADFGLDGRTISNQETWEFLKSNIPFFTCPDPEIEKTYYFRWWTYRKHLYQTKDGWVVTVYSSLFRIGLIDNNLGEFFKCVLEYASSNVSDNIGRLDESL